MCGNSSGVLFINAPLRTIFFVVLFLLTCRVAAQDITDKSAAQDSPDDYLIVEISPGLGFVEQRIPLVGFNFDDPSRDPDTPTLDPVFGINAFVDWKRYFLDLRSPGHATIGYHLRKTSNHRTTLVFGQTRYSYNPSRTEGYESLSGRQYDQILGIRSSHAFGNRTVQLELHSDIRRGNGEGAVVSVQEYRPWGTWNLKGRLSAEYVSSGISNYFFGISNDESAGLATAYTPGSALIASAAVQLEAQMNEFAVFRAAYETSRYPDNILDSPLVTSRYSYEFSLGVYFVFGTAKY